MLRFPTTVRCRNDVEYLTSTNTASSVRFLHAIKPNVCKLVHCLASISIAVSVTWSQLTMFKNFNMGQLSASAIIPVSVTLAQRFIFNHANDGQLVAKVCSIASVHLMAWHAFKYTSVWLLLASASIDTFVIFEKTISKCSNFVHFSNSTATDTSVHFHFHAFKYTNDGQLLATANIDASVNCVPSSKLRCISCGQLDVSNCMVASFNSNTIAIVLEKCKYCSNGQFNASAQIEPFVNR